MVISSQSRMGQYRDGHREDAPYFRILYSSYNIFIRVQLFYGNKMPSQSINSFSATMASTSELQVQEQKAASNEIKQQVQEVQIFQIQCLQVIINFIGQ